jgi:hypothetical protein
MAVEIQPRRSRRRLYAVALGAGAVLAAVVLIWFQPQKLVLNKTVNDTAPEAPVSPSKPGTLADAQAASQMRLSGSFRSLEHPTTGSAIVEDASGSGRVLRLESFRTSNGPDVRVYLSAGPSSNYAEDFVELAKLKGNIGNQNYDVPDGVNLMKYRYAVIWCKRFSVGFGVAELT